MKAKSRGDSAESKAGMNTDRKTLKQVAVADRNECDDRSWLSDVLIVSSNDAWAVSMEKILSDNLYETSVTSNGNEIIDKLKKTWYHLILIDLDSINVPEDHLATNIRKMEPDMPIIGLGNYSSGPCPNITCLKKPLSHGLLQKYFPKIVSEKGIKVGLRVLYPFPVKPELGNRFHHH